MKNIDSWDIVYLIYVFLKALENRQMIQSLIKNINVVCQVKNNSD